MADDNKYKAGQPIGRLDNETQAGYGLGVQGFILNSSKNKKAIFYGHMGETMGFSSMWLYKKNRQAFAVFEPNITYNMANAIFNSKIMPPIVDKIINEGVLEKSDSWFQIVCSL